MTPVKEKIIEAVSLMIDKEAEVFQNLIQSRYIISSKSWDGIEEVEPDNVDFQMLREIETDPDCHSFVSSEEAMQELRL